MFHFAFKNTKTDYTCKENDTLKYQCKRGYARSETYVSQQKIENRPKKRCILKAPENYL